jgi:hypothetical protein
VWEAGYDGTGMTIAVLDTGITSNHEDVSGKVVAERNFSSAPDAEDHYGHGTHVASIAAGTGAHSDGTYTGVAPGAELLSGKVLGNDGSGQTSWILQGMEWAVAQDADIVNMSLGGPSNPTGTDPLEEAVNTLSAESDTLFVVAAGNDGRSGPGTIGSPGTADAALTVGAVDKQDQLAGFSSRGPRLRDGAVKPDVTAPGVNIAAALAPGSTMAEQGDPVADGYVGLDGTSMATPHVAGAAALLAQRHPDWTGEQLKAALTASTQPGGYSPFEQGTGRIDVPAALEQTVITDEASLTFGTAEWPHTDDEPITRELTYRNLGEQDVTLQLSTETTGPNGDPAPPGTFTLSADEVTVPAGGTATVEVIADTTVPQLDGAFTAVVTATDGERTIRTAGAVQREAESYDLTVEATDREGNPATDWRVQLTDTGTGEQIELGPETDATTRIPAGDYLVDAAFFVGDDPGEAAGIDSLVQPQLSLTRDRTLTLDARDAEPIDVTVPDAQAEMFDLNINYTASPGGGDDAGIVGGWYAGPVPQGMSTAQLGGLPEGWEMASAVSTSWRRGDREYHTAEAREGAFFTGLTEEVTQDELAQVSVGQGASLQERTGALLASDSFTGMSGFNPRYQSVPRTTEVFVQADTGAEWRFNVLQADAEGSNEAVQAVYSSGYATYEAGERYRETLNVGVFGPLLREGDGLFRDGNTIHGQVNPLADGAGHEGPGDFLYPSASTTLYRDGEEYATAENVLDLVEFDVPADEAEYELITTLTRDGVAANVSSVVTASYTFTSEAPAQGETAVLPAAAVRYAPELALDSTGPAGETVSVPVTVQTSAMADAPAVSVEVSFDGGETWEESPLTDGAVDVVNPAAGGSVSFRTTVEDAGNTTTQTIIDAYRTA